MGVVVFLLVVVWNNACINQNLPRTPKISLVTCGIGTALVGRMCLSVSRPQDLKCGDGTTNINDVCEINVSSKSLQEEAVVANRAPPDSSFLKMWKLDSREVSRLMSSEDVVGEDHVTETLMHMIHLKHLVDGVKSGTACQGNQKIATNGGLPLFILDVGANVGVFSWHAIRGLLPPVSRWDSKNRNDGPGRCALSFRIQSGCAYGGASRVQPEDNTKLGGKHGQTFQPWA
jgi:hypothetical protein